MNRTRLSVVFAVDPAAPAARRCAEQAANALASVAAIRLVPHDRLVGRDLRECDRFACLGLATFDAIPHLRELATQMREKTIAVLFGEQLANATTPKALTALRRFCSRVLVDDRSAIPALREHLLVPVHAIAEHDATALWNVLTLAPGCSDDVECHLQEATQWMTRGNQEAAFSSASRALQKAPDQPGIVADVARLLANLGQRERAVVLCRHFLQQRPDAAPVDHALRELQPLG